LAAVKCTKNEMHRLQKKLVQLKKYLPTLQLKKMLLQAEVNKAKVEIEHKKQRYKEDLLTLEPSMKLLSDPSTTLLKDQLLIEKKVVVYENIAGIEVPSLKSLTFKQSSQPIQYKPFWHIDLTKQVQSAKNRAIALEISEEKKRILEEELRGVSIRVNLFEKRLIPDIEREIGVIKIFLGDQVLAAVALSKLAKEKIEKKKSKESEAKSAS
jgi:V/A-type H+-transporting ATPase subunit D